MEHHDLDIYPIPREKTALYINEPWLIDKSIMERVQLVTDLKKRPDEESDNIRIYVPLDLNRNAILRRLDSVIYHYGETNEENELDFSMDIEMIISQIEIYIRYGLADICRKTESTVWRQKLWFENLLKGWKKFRTDVQKDFRLRQLTD